MVQWNTRIRRRGENDCVVNTDLYESIVMIWAIGCVQEVKVGSRLLPCGKPGESGCEVDMDEQVLA